MDRQQAVMNFIHENFFAEAVRIEPCSLFPYGLRVIDKSNDEMVVYFDLLTDSVQYVFPDKVG
ncbi:MAG: hypothetical protein E6713_10395 [Sporomusaceae bacterium]|nr:hypothetical protein [Sporomusaceae bacterium]